MTRDAAAEATFRREEIDCAVRLAASFASRAEDRAQRAAELLEDVARTAGEFARAYQADPLADPAPLLLGFGSARAALDDLVGEVDGTAEQIGMIPVRVRFPDL